jgi:hypothetical protein
LRLAIGCRQENEVLEISGNVAEAYTRQGLSRLRERILAGWHERLLGPATSAGEDGRNRALAQVEAMARDNPSLTEAQLVMLADVAVVKQADAAAADARGRG